MSIKTRAELTTSITKWLNRLESDTDLVPFIPDFITLAETEMKADVDARILEKRTALAEINVETDLPTDYGKVTGVYMHDTVGGDDGLQYELSYMTAKEMARHKQLEGEGGNPKHYTITGSKIRFFPDGSGADPKWQFSMTYTSIPVLGPLDGDTNDLLTQWPNLYLYGSLVHSAPFLEEDNRAAVWGGLYNNAVTKINDEAAYSEAGTSQISMPTS